jgi:SAM-dependent methyltransferase
MSLREFWDEQAEAWGRFAGTPGHDVFHEEFNFPAFVKLLPPAGRAALDLGCGEGRLGAALSNLGYSVIGVDASARMVELASERHEALVADAAELPFEDGSFDLVIAYMSVMNFDDPEGAITEASRILEPGGRFCTAVLHPIDGAGRFESDDDPSSPFVIEGSYFDPPAKLWSSERDGIEMTFLDQALPLERLFRAHENAGLLIEIVREPRPSDEFIAKRRRGARRLRIPLLLQLRAVKP